MRHIKRTFCCKQVYDKYKYLGINTQPSLTLQNHHLDTSIWNDIKIVESDIFLVSPAKSGSTWLYEVISQLLYHNNAELNQKPLIELCLSPPFSSFRPGGATYDAKIETIKNIDSQLLNKNIKHRVFKFHEPVESIPFNPNCKYVFIARDFRDIIWSFYNHYRNYSPSIMKQINEERYNYELKSKLPDFDNDLNKNNDFTEYEFWKMSIEIGDDFGNPDGYPFWSQLWVIGSWLNCANNINNIKLVHYNEMKNDLPKVVKEIAEFLEIEMNDINLNTVLQNCEFNTMKSKQFEIFGEIGKFWWKQPEEFFYKGINNRWQNVLNTNDIQNYRSLAKRYLTEKDINWLENGC